MCIVHTHAIPALSSIACVTPSYTHMHCSLSALLVPDLSSPGSPTKPDGLLTHAHSMTQCAIGNHTALRDPGLDALSPTPSTQSLFRALLPPSTQKDRSHILTDSVCHSKRHCPPSLYATFNHSPHSSSSAATPSSHCPTAINTLSHFHTVMQHPECRGDLDTVRHATLGGRPARHKPS